MKITNLILGSFTAFTLVGCGTTRPILDVAAAGGGAALANELSDGNPVITAAGAAGGVILSEGLQYAARKQSDKSFVTGYEKGRSDAVKQQYWVQVNQQKQLNVASENVRLYEIPLPEQKIDGVILNPTKKFLRIEE
jgi:hypothetical protein